MKIILVGASGTIGKAVFNELKSRHEIISAGKNSGDIRVDITDGASVIRMYKDAGSFDALISAAGRVHFGELASMTDDLYQIGLQDKLMGQVNLVLHGLNFINDKGSFTLTSGILSEDPVKSGSGASLVNGAIDSFVKAAAIEMPRGVRINAVSPTIVTESLPEFAPYFRGFKPVKASDLAMAYSKSVEGHQSGRVYKEF